MMKEQNINYYNFLLPQELIAYFPSENRGDSRLLIAKKDELKHDVFSNIINLINPGDALVINNTKVTKAKLYANKISGGNLEILIIKYLGDNNYSCLIKGLHK